MVVFTLALVFVRARERGQQRRRRDVGTMRRRLQHVLALPGISVFAVGVSLALLCTKDLLELG